MLVSALIAVTRVTKAIRDDSWWRFGGGDMTLGGVFTGGESSWWRGDHNRIKRKLSVSQFVFIHSAYYFLVILCVGEFVVGEFACGRIHWLP